MVSVTSGDGTESGPVTTLVRGGLAEANGLESMPSRTARRDLARRLLDEGKFSLAEVAALAEHWMAEALEERGAQAAERGPALFDLTAQLWPSDGQRRDDFDPSLYRQAGRGWAMVDALLGGRVPVAAAAWSEAARQFDGVRINQFPRALAALTGLARRVALAGGARSRRHEQLLLLRIGLLGR